jgi:GTP-binding protein Era
VREAITVLTHKEVPYKTAVVIDRFVEEKKRTVIHATIHVERDSQKGIMIGKGGQMLVTIGTNAREQIEKLLGCPVVLHLHVNVSADWTSNPAGLRSMGYE